MLNLQENIMDKNLDKINIDDINIDNKNRKIEKKILKNDNKNEHLLQNYVNNDKNCGFAIYSINEEKEMKMKAYAKALLTIYPTIPNIIQIVDNIVEKRATTSISLSSIYSGTSHTYKQFEKVIDMTERKCKLLNIYSLIKEILTPMSLRDYEIVDLKFFRRHKINTIAERLEMDERSLYRRLNKILESIVKFLNMNMIDISVIEHMIRGEGWIKEIYKKSLEELQANKIRSIKNIKKKEV